MDSNTDIRLEIPYPKTEAGKKQWNSEYGLNAYYAGKNWRKRREDADYWHWLVVMVIKANKIQTGILPYPVTIHFKFNDNMDCSNHAMEAKMIEDALKGVFLKDDSPKYVREISMGFHDKDVIEVLIRKVGNDI